MKAENERLRIEFFRSVFAHPEVGAEHLLQKLEQKGPPDMVIIPESMEGRIYDSFGQFCLVHVNRDVTEGPLYFLWKDTTLSTLRQLSRDAYFTIEN